MSEVISLAAFIIGGTIIGITIIMSAFVRYSEDNDNVKSNLKTASTISLIAVIIGVIVGIIASIYGGVKTGLSIVTSGVKFAANNPEMLVGA